jgi:hypothetical protein
MRAVAGALPPDDKLEVMAARHCPGHRPRRRSPRDPAPAGRDSFAYTGRLHACQEGGYLRTIDVDSTICVVYGRSKQGAAFGYTKVRDHHSHLPTCAQTGQVLFHRIRGDSAGTACGAASFLTETVSRVRHAGAERV